jgi:hypothetical protein
MNNVTGTISKHEAFNLVYQENITTIYYALLNSVIESNARNPIGSKNKFPTTEDSFIELPYDCTIQYLKDNGIINVVRFVNTNL